MSVVSLEQVRHLLEAQRGIEIARVEVSFFRVEDGTIVASLRLSTDPDQVDSPEVFAAENFSVVASLMLRLAEQD